MLASAGSIVQLPCLQVILWAIHSSDQYGDSASGGLSTDHLRRRLYWPGFGEGQHRLPFADIETGQGTQPMVCALPYVDVPALAASGSHVNCKHRSNPSRQAYELPCRTWPSNLPPATVRGCPMGLWSSLDGHPRRNTNPCANL